MPEEPLRIVFSVTNDLNYDQRMIRICTSLHAAGYDVQLIGRSKKNSKSLEPRSFNQHRLSCFFQAGKLFYLEYNLRLLIYLLRQNRPAAYSAVDLDSIGPMALVARFKDRPLIFDAHEYFWETPEVSRRPLIQRFWKFWAGLWVPKAQLAYTVAPQLAGIFEGHHGIPFTTIRNLPLAGKPVVHKSTRDFVLLYQGMLNEGRGLESIITAMSEIPRAKLLLAGDGDIAEQLKLQVRSLGLNERVEFLGMIRPADLPEITTQADLGINLLEDRSKSYYYSLANKCFDYIAAGVPAMHMDFPEYQTVNEAYDFLILVPDLDPAQLAKQINALISDGERMKHLRKQTAIAAKELTWEQEEKTLVTLYHSILRDG